MASRTTMLQKDQEIAGTLWTQAQTQFPQKSFLFSPLLPSLVSAAPSHCSQLCSVIEIRIDYSSEAFVFRALAASGMITELYCLFPKIPGKSCLSRNLLWLVISHENVAVC